MATTRITTARKRIAALPILHVVGTVAICFGVILGPLLLGSTFPLPRLGLEAAMTVAILCWIASWRGRWTTPALPIAVAGIGLLQLMPLPDSVLIRLSPVSAGAWKIASPDTWGTIAVDPGATAAGLRRLLLGLGTIGAVTTLGRDSRVRTAISTAIAVSCALVIALAYLLPSSNENRIALGFIDLAGPIHYWKSPVHAPLQTAGFSEQDLISVAGYNYVSDSWVNGDRIGPYIVSNQFAGGVCLMLPVGLALWLWWARDRAPAAARIAATVTMALIAVYAVAEVAKSRAGTASLMVALAALAALVVSSALARRTWLAITAVGFSAWLAMAMIMHGPFRGLEKTLPPDLQVWIAPLVADGRVWASQLAKRIFAAAPVFGTGFGSYYGLSARLDEGSPPWFFAHNDYFQLLAETGLVGGVIASAYAIVLGRAAWRFFQTSTPPDRVRDAGYWAALVGIAAHSAFDWNLHVPANGFLACVVTGLALSGVSWNHSATATNPSATIRRQPSLMALIAAVYLLLFMILIRDAWSDTMQKRMREAIAMTRVPAATNVAHSLTMAITEGERIAKWDPSSATVALLVGQLKLHAAATSADLTPRAKEAMVGAAAQWLTRASRRSAACRGLPLPDPRTHTETLRGP